MPGNPGIFPGAQALMPQQRERTESDWAPRDYWTQPPQRIPPKPPFEAWVPPGETITFGESPRDTSRYQTFTGSIVPEIQPIPPPPPIPRDQAVQHNARPDWALRDYSPNPDVFSILATPLPPPPNNQLPPQHNARPDWTLRDYAPYQGMGAWFENRVVLNIVPPSDTYVFGEFERDMTPYTLTITRRSQPGAPSARPVPQIRIAEYAIRPYDYTAQYLVLATSVAQAGIPQVPLGGTFVAFDYEPRDLTPELIAIAVRAVPQAPPPQIPPSAIPFIEWPGWQWGQYQALGDQFSAIGAPRPGAYPPGLTPQFTLEALIRDVSHPTSLYTVQTFILPPPRPFVFAQAPTFLEWRQWYSNEYPLFDDRFSAWAITIPIPPAFRVMAVTSGYYNGAYYEPGDVFDLKSPFDFSDASVDYSKGLAATKQFGWMKRVTPGTPLFYTIGAQPIPLFPVVDPVPPKRFLY